MNDHPENQPELAADRVALTTDHVAVSAGDSDSADADAIEAVADGWLAVLQRGAGLGGGLAARRLTAGAAARMA